LDYLLNFDYAILIRLVVAAILGGLVGWERGERSNQEAGLRTHIIVCLGAALVMIISESLAAEYGGDMMRMGAQVISGIGFLGVGCIIVTGNRVRGITTAAGLWTTACVGLAIGSGHFILATVVVLLMLFVMWGLRSIMGRNRKPLDDSEPAELKEMLEKLSELEAQVSALKSDIEMYERKDV